MADQVAEAGQDARAAAQAVAGPAWDAWQQWADTQAEGHLRPVASWLLARDAFTAGWVAGATYLAKRIAGEIDLTATVTRPGEAPEEAREEAGTGTGWPA